MPACPHCGSDVAVRKLVHQGLFASYRTCPDCGGHFTVDAKTRQRQAVALVVALAALVLTLLLNFQGVKWLGPAVVVYTVLGALVYWGNKRVRFVPVQKPEPQDR